MIFNFKKREDIKKFYLKYTKKNIIDYLVIGSGPAGITLTKNLIRKLPKKNIVLVERGNFVDKNLTDKKIESKNLKIKLNSRYFAVGGASNTWGSGSTYLEKIEMNEKKNFKKNIWPLKYDELNKLYKITENNYSLKIPNQNNLKKNLLHERSVLIPKKKINFKTFIDYNEIDLIINCKIEYFEEAKNPVCYFFSKDKTFKISSKKLIHSLGAIETISLLFRSIKKKKLQKVNKKVLGRYFMNHPKIKVGKISKCKKLEEYVTKSYSNFDKFIALSLPLKIQKKFKLLNSCVKIKNSLEINYKNDIYRNLKRKNIISIVKNLLKLIVLKLSKNIKFLESKEIYTLVFHLEMEPNFNNRIYFKNNKLFIDYKLNKNDIKSFKKLYFTIMKYFSKEFRTNDDFFKKIDFNKPEIDASHHMGGTRHHSNKSDGFVDRNLKINGLKNTYICSSSIFPTGGSLSPTATLVALSIKLSDYLSKIQK